MLGNMLPEPVLSVSLDAVEKLQGGEDAIGALWSVFTKVKDSVPDGRRLENMSWRLWHRARVVPQMHYARSIAKGLPGYPEMLARPLSSPSLSLSSSSEGTGTSSDWDRDTAVGEDDESQSLNVSGTRRNPAVSPLTEKPYLDLGPGTNLSQARASQILSPASSSRSCHQVETTQGDAHLRISPSAPSDFTPHHPLQTVTDAGTDPCREQVQGIVHSDSQHQRVSPAQRNSGLEAPPPHDSISPRTFTTQGSRILPNRSGTPSHTTTSDSSNSLFATGILAAALTSSSMPISLPSATGSRKSWSVGRIIAELFPEKFVVSNSDNVASHTPEQNVIAREPGRREQQPTLTPIIVEPQSSTPPSSEASTSSWFHLGNSPSPAPNSAATSATSTPRQSFPTVVVVNPTPHPTPPATPSPGAFDAPFGLRPTATSFDRPDRSSDGWKGGGAENGQLATPVSMNGDAGSPDEPKFVMVEPRNNTLKELQSHTSPLDSTSDVTALPMQMLLLPAAAITLPEKPTDLHSTSSHLPTPSSDSPHALQAAEMAQSFKSTPAPIPAPPPPEDKKFFLAAPHSGGSGGSGLDSSESPDSLEGGSVSPDKTSCGGMGYTRDAMPLVAPRVLAPLAHGLNRQDRISREEEVASSFSASSPPGRAPSVTSSRGGSRFKVRPTFSVAGGSRRKTTPKKSILVPKHSPRKELDQEVLLAEVKEVKPKDQDERTKAKGKGRDVAERTETVAPGPSPEQIAPTVRASQQHLQHRTQPPQNLRQLPTNPPRQHPPAARPSVTDSPSHPAAPLPPTKLPAHTRQPPYHPQLGHLGLGHLPTIPPRQRRPIEITETSSEYETTDTDESSWESESGSDDEAVEGGAPAAPPNDAHEPVEPSTKHRKTSGASNNHRTRDAGEFARDAALEAQRQKELFQKLPTRSYSHLGQVPRTKSGLSLLFRPDPSLFPEGHPYRQSQSSSDILARNWSAPAPPSALGTVSKRSSMAGPMQTSVTAQPVVSSVNSKPVMASGSDGRRGSGPQRGGFRPRGRPEGQEEETDSGDEDPENIIQVASSVAERRLAALMGQKPTVQHQQRLPPSRSNSHPEPQVQAPAPQPMSRTTTAPVLMHPYLPDPAPLQTPHTVRRNIISQELDEELRRNLLWERSQNQIQGRPARAPGSILPGPWRPLTALKSEEARETQSNASDKGPGKRPFATQRTKSWAGDYHASGW